MQVSILKTIIINLRTSTAKLKADMYGELHRNLRLWSVQEPVSSLGKSIHVELGMKQKSFIGYR